MNWSKETDTFLKNWLAPDTSYKKHPLDDARFYDFIIHVWIDEQRIWDEGLTRDKMNRIAKELHPDWPSDMIGDFVDDRISEGTGILDFLSNAKEKGFLSKL